MAKKIKSTLEAEKILENMSLDMLMAFNTISQDEKIFEQLKKFFNGFILLEKDKIVGLSSDVAGADDAILKTSKQNFHRGRTASVYLVHVLINNASKEIEKREARSK